MRLCLAIHRHGLPPAAVLWTVGSTASATTSAARQTGTVAQLLEHINETIPLEAADWGLEDYVVEVHGFECLHFQEVDSILKDGDHVTIRPLSTTDLRGRKLSGRHQISSDGKHLIDGVAFGRPFFRTSTTRPPVVIPPRKRRRLAEVEHAAGDPTPIEHDDDGRQLVVRADFEDADQENRPPQDHFEGFPEDEDDDEDDDDDEDFEPGDISEIEDEDDDMEEEGEFCELDEESMNDATALDTPHDNISNDHASADIPSNRRHRTEDRVLADLHVPKSRMNALRITDGSGKDLLDEAGQSPITGDAGRLVNGSSPLSRLTRSTSQSNSAVSSAKKERRSSFKILTDSGTYAQAGAPISDGLDESAPTRSDPTAVRPSKRRKTRQSLSSPGKSADSDEVMESSSESDSDSDDTSSSESDSSSSSESTSSDEGSSGSEPEENSSLAKKKTVEATDDDRSFAEGTKIPSEESKAQDSPNVAPGQGMMSTRNRNVRRRERKRLDHLIRTGELPIETTLEDYRLWSSGRAAARGPGQSRQVPARASDETKTDAAPNATKQVTPLKSRKTKLAVTEDAEFQARRSALLASIATGGVDVTPESAAASAPSTILARSEAGSPAVASPSLEESEKENARPALDQGEVLPVVKRAKSKLDLDSSRRLLFGSLGLKTPKTKEAEEKLRLQSKEHAEAEVAKHHKSRRIEPLEGEQQGAEMEVEAESGQQVADVEDEAEGEQQVVEVEGEAESEQQSADVEDEAEGEQQSAEVEGEADFNDSWDDEAVIDDSWKDDINLSAVECVGEEEAVYSVPPFPFVQHWHRPYASGGGRGARKKRKRRQAQGLHDEGDHYEYDYEGGEALDYDDGLAERGPTTSNLERWKAFASEMAGDDVNGAANDQLMRDTNDAAAAPVDDDLPAMPADPQICTALEMQDLKPGMVIGFQQLIMTADWQPSVSGFRTAMVDKVLENGRLELTLAKRDRAQKEKAYDEDTGNRVYGKFEMPDEEDDDEEDDGFLELTFSELREPKVVRDVDTAEAVAPPEMPDGTEVVNDTSNAVEPGTISTTEEPDTTVAIGPPDKGIMQRVTETAQNARLSHELRSDVEDTTTDHQPDSLGDRVMKRMFGHTLPKTIGGTDGAQSPKFHGLDLPTPRETPTTGQNVVAPDQLTTADVSSVVGLRGGGLSEDLGLDWTVTSAGYPKLPTTLSSLLHSDASAGYDPISPGDGDDDVSTTWQVEQAVARSASVSPLPEYEVTPIPSSPPEESGVPLSRFIESRVINGATSVLLPIGGQPGLSSDSEFPELDILFSTARTSFGSMKEEPKNAEQPVDVSNEAAATPPDANTANDAPIVLSDTEVTPRASKVSTAAQIIDLIASSPILAWQSSQDGPSLNAELGLPAGPGWVQKKRVGEAATGRRATLKKEKRARERPKKTKSM